MPLTDRPGNWVGREFENLHHPTVVQVTRVTDRYVHGRIQDDTLSSGHKALIPVAVFRQNYRPHVSQQAPVAVVIPPAPIQKAQQLTIWSFQEVSA